MVYIPSPWILVVTVTVWSIEYGGSDTMPICGPWPWTIGGSHVFPLGILILKESSFHLNSLFTLVLSWYEEAHVNHLERLQRTSHLRPGDKHGSKKVILDIYNSLPMWGRIDPWPQTYGPIHIFPVFSSYSRPLGWGLDLCGAGLSCPYCALLTFLTHEIMGITEWLLFYITKFEVGCYNLVVIWNNSISICNT